VLPQLLFLWSYGVFHCFERVILVHWTYYLCNKYILFIIFVYLWTLYVRVCKINDHMHIYNEYLVLLVKSGMPPISLPHALHDQCSRHPRRSCLFVCLTSSQSKREEQQSEFRFRRDWFTHKTSKGKIKWSSRCEWVKENNTECVYFWFYLLLTLIYATYN
jgi:hypothetical protein